MPTRRIEDIIKRANISEEEISRIISNLEKIENKIGEDKIKLVVNNIVKDTNFRQRFIANPETAVNEMKPRRKRFLIF
ncbi:MAG: hypothetical protein ACFFBD_07350 [Candidatus Hodarchaeota archaeon]